MQTEYIGQLQQAVEELINSLTPLTAEQVNQIHFEGSWTAGQATEHVLKSIENMPGLFSNETEVTSRDPHQHEAQIKAIFLDFDNKMKSPEFILPGDGPFVVSDLITRLQGTVAAITERSAEADLSLTLTSFAFPGIGHLTGYELICFAYCHTARHARQVQKITEAISK